MRERKPVTIGVPATEQIRSDFQIVAELRGISMASILRAYMVEQIREEKSRQPDAFSERQTAEQKKIA